MTTINRIYSLDSTQNSEYFSTNLITANKDYIVVELVEMKSQKPMLRVYSRNSDYFSTVKEQVPLYDFLDLGSFISFINPDLNFLLVRSSNDFKIYRLQNPTFEIHMWGLSPQEIEAGYNIAPKSTA